MRCSHYTQCNPTRWLTLERTFYLDETNRAFFAKAQGLELAPARK
jgi:hypothetical protein